MTDNFEPGATLGTLDSMSTLQTSEEKRRLKDELVHVRQGELAIARQNAYRTEMAFVQHQSELRRARFLSFGAYVVCAVSAFAVLLFFAQPSLLQRWRAITIAIATLAICLVFTGIKRDARYAENSWTRLRFKGPNHRV